MSHFTFSVNTVSLVEQWVINQIDAFVTGTKASEAIENFISNLRFTGNNTNDLEGEFYVTTIGSKLKVYNETPDCVSIVIFDTKFYIDLDTMYTLNKLPMDVTNLLQYHIDLLD